MGHIIKNIGGMHGKIRFWSGEGRGKLVKRTAAEVSVRQIEIPDVLIALRVWRIFAGLPVLKV